MYFVNTVSKTICYLCMNIMSLGLVLMLFTVYGFVLSIVATQQVCSSRK